MPLIAKCDTCGKEVIANVEKVFTKDNNTSHRYALELPGIRQYSFRVGTENNKVIVACSYDCAVTFDKQDNYYTDSIVNVKKSR